MMPGTFVTNAGCGSNSGPAWLLGCSGHRSSRPACCAGAVYVAPEVKPSERLWLDKGRTGPRHLDFRHEVPNGTLRLSDWDRPAWSPGTRGEKDGKYEGDSMGESLSKVCEEGELQQAVDGLDVLVHRGTYVHRSLFGRFLRRCREQKDLRLGRRVHTLALRSGYGSDAFVGNHLIGMYAAHGRMEDAAEAFAKVAEPDGYVWGAMILAHARLGEPGQAIDLYRRMRVSGVSADNHVFVAVLKACAAAGDVVSGKEVHADIVASNVSVNFFLGSSLVNMYSKCGSLEDARRVFDRLPTRSAVVWNAMIAGYTQHGLGAQALALYESLQEQGNTVATSVTFLCLLQACACIGALEQGRRIHSDIQERGLEGDLALGNCLIDMYSKCGSLVDARRVFDGLRKRDVVSWTAMIAGYAQHGMGREALAVYSSMKREGMTAANCVTFVCLLRACACIGALNEGKELHEQMKQSGLEGDVVVGNCLVDMYAKCGSLGEARAVFDRLPNRDVVTWTSMISGYAQHGFGQEALALYGSMQHGAMALADAVTLVCLLRACGSIGALYKGRHLHAQIEARGLVSDASVGNCLVDMYAKCGSLGDARRVFESLPTRDVVAWGALLNGYAEHCDGEQAIECFNEMRQQGVEPDEATFISLLAACSQSGMVREGQHYFNMMVQGYGIIPSDYHFTCMVDLLGRAGRLDEAESFLLTMPFEQYAVAWTSLLTACKSHGDVQRGRRCFDRIVQLEPDNATPYVLLGSTYAQAGMWDEVDTIENLRTSACAWKTPAKVCIELNNKVHEFTVGDDRSDISPRLSRMNLRLKEEGGHVPQTELVLKAMPEQEKEDALCGHAEKLALAFGLLNTPHGTPLLVTKNLRMCNDCHNSTKILSRLEDRAIVVRDSRRVHHFAAGICSCQDRI